MNADYADDITFLTNTPTQAKSLLHHLEQAARGISLHANTNETEYMPFKWGAISTLNGSPLKLVDKFTYLDSSISSTESNVNMHLA